MVARLGDYVGVPSGGCLRTTAKAACCAQETKERRSVTLREFLTASIIGALVGPIIGGLAVLVVVLTRRSWRRAGGLERITEPEEHHMKCTLTVSAHGARIISHHTSLKHALVSVNADVDSNEAAPFEIQMRESSIIGAKPATFDSLQIYALLDLVRDDPTPDLLAACEYALSRAMQPDEVGDGRNWLLVLREAIAKATKGTDV